MRPPPRSAFSLIELLVVVSIIVVLAALVLPTMGIVRNGAQTVRCAGALRQLGIAVLAYGSDAEQVLPRLKTPRADNPAVPIHWFDAIAVYLELADDQTATSYAARHATPIWGCPSWPKDAASTLPYRPGYGMVWYPLAPTSYKTNFMWLDPSGGFNPFGVDISITKVGDRPRRIMLGETTDWPLSTGTLPATAYPADWDPSRHRGRANYAFFDGHVQAIPAAANAYLGTADPTSTAWNP